MQPAIGVWCVPQGLSKEHGWDDYDENGDKHDDGRVDTGEFVDEFSCLALLACASVTRRMMRCMVVSSTKRVTWTSNSPLPLMVPESTSSPACLATQALSPVMAAWLSSLSPLMMMPSMGRRSPARTMMRSPIFNSSTGTRLSSPFVRRKASLGARSANSVRTLRALALV